MRDSGERKLSLKKCPFLLDHFSIWIATVKLPVGKRITKLAYYHKSVTSATVSDTWVQLVRVKMGEMSSGLAYTDCTDTSADVILVEDTSIYYPNIKSGYTYYVRVSSANGEGLIYGIKIFYE